MYRRYYGLSSQPFALHPDPERIFLSESHQEALSILRYGVLAGKGFLLLTGEVGTGKTTLLAALLAELNDDVLSCLLSSPTLSREEFLAFLAQEFSLEEVGNKALFLRSFGQFLDRCREQGKRVLLIVDEAHVMPVELLEEVRLLSNLDTTGGVLSVFLVGQPELNDHLSGDRLLPLRQRIGIRFHLTPFDRANTQQYVLFRLRSAGARNLDLFTEGALELVHDLSQGTPRLINVICDHALLSGFADNRPRIDRNMIRECARDLHLPGEETSRSVRRAGKTGPRTARRRRLVVVVVLAAALALVLAVFSFQWPSLGGRIPESWYHGLEEIGKYMGG